MFAETEISYPGTIDQKTGMFLGGIGTGCLSLDRAGRFQEIRLQNNWEGNLPKRPAASFFSVFVEDGERSVGRVLQLEQEGGLPCITALTYRGDFPFLNIDYLDKALPLELSLETFSPLIPHDAESSSIPAIFFTFKLRNISRKPLKARVAFSWQNDISIWTYRGRAIEAVQGRRNATVAAPLSSVSMTTSEALLAGSEYCLSGLPGQDVRYECVADWWNIRPLQCAGPDFDAGHGENFKFAADNTGALAIWRSFIETGQLPAERSFADQLGKYSYHAPAGAVAGAVKLIPGEEKEIRFVLAWRFPYHLDGSYHQVGNYYAERFADARAVVAYAAARFEDWRKRCARWKRLLANASLPEKSLKHLSAVLYLLTRITWRIKDGTLIYYEAIACTRMFAVLLEQYAAPVMAALFPELHAGALRFYAHHQLESGEIPTTLGFAGSISTPEFRVFSPNDVPAFALSVYNNLMWGGDRDFAKEMYPKVKAAMSWGFTLDVDSDGVPDCHGVDQGWDTWPMHGAVGYIADLWIHALEAVEKMAADFEDNGFQQRCAAIRKKAVATLENRLWNGAYYDISFNPVNGARCNTSFMDQFAGHSWGWPLGLSASGSRERIITAVRSIFQNNVELVAHLPLSGAQAGGAPASANSGKSKQSRAFVPCTIGSFAANAARYGEFERAVKLFDKASAFVIDKLQEPWLAQLLFDSADGAPTYGFHYIDLLMIWDFLHALTGHQINALAGTLTLAPPKIPVRGPLFSRLFFGECEVTAAAACLRNAADKDAAIRRLEIKLDGRSCVFDNVIIPANTEATFDLRII